MEARISENPALTLVSSPRVGSPDQLWVARKKPNVVLISNMGNQHDLDGVIMLWGTAPSHTNIRPTSIDLYMIDIERRQAHRQKGNVKRSVLEKLTNNALAQFLAERPEVVLARTTPASQSATTTPQSTPAVKTAAITPGIGPVTLTAGTFVDAVLTENLNSALNTRGEVVYLKAKEGVTVDGQIAIPKGARVKAKIGDIAKRGMVGKGGGLQFHPVSVEAIDGQWIRLDKDQFGAGGAGATVGGIIGLGLFAKGRAGFVLRGTEYEVTIRRDTVVDTAKVKAGPILLRQAALQTSAKFQKITGKIKFVHGKVGKDFVLEITLTPKLAPLVRQGPASVRIVAILDEVLRKPISSISVELDPKKNVLKATFDAWNLIRYSQPGATPMIAQFELSDGRLAQAEATLDTNWKLK